MERKRQHHKQPANLPYPGAATQDIRRALKAVADLMDTTSAPRRRKIFSPLDEVRRAV